MTITIETIQQTLDNIERMLVGMPNAQRVTGQQVVVVEGLSDISDNLGLIKAGEFRSGINDPGFNFTGIRMGSPGWIYNNKRYAIVGIKEDVLQFGLSNEDGAIYAGQGAVRLNASGIAIHAGVDSSSSENNRILLYQNDGTTDHILGDFGSSFSGTPGTGASVFIQAYKTNAHSWGRNEIKMWAFEQPGGGGALVVKSTFSIGTDGKVAVDALNTITTRSSGDSYFKSDTILNTDAPLVKIIPRSRTDLTAEFDAMGLWVTDTTRTFAAGGRGQMAHTAISRPNWSAASASTITFRSATFFVDGAPALTNFTAARNYAAVFRGGVWVEDGGLHLGDGEVAGTGSLGYSGNLMAHRGSANYTGYIYVPLTAPLTAAAWTASTRSTTANTLIDLSAVFDVPDGVRAVCVRTTIRDSGSAANDCSLGLSAASGSAPVLFVHRCSGIANNMWSNSWGIVPCDSNGDIYFRITASGANTMTVTLDIVGYFF